MALSSNTTASASNFSSCSKSARASFRSPSCVAISSLVVTIFCLRAEMCSFRSFASSVIRLMVALVLVISPLRSSMSFLFLLSARWQRSRCAMSACSSLRRRAIMLSMDWMTLSKWPLALTCTASFARLRLWKRPARAFSFSYAAERLLCEFSADNCRKLPVAFSKVFCASRLWRIMTAWAMPRSSSVRSRVRSDHSAALSLQAALVSAKKASSALSSSAVVSRTMVVSASCLVLSAFSKFCFSNVFCSVSSSACFVAMSCSCAFCWSASSTLAFSKSAVKASYMPFRTPWICVDCGA
mmetsp:Transcript_464/g.1247  ORF Transcript_464/g.1247 Transcript_464/m.1247 type:complete len:298 (+) Transcript_464:722-1615(+)